VWARGKLMELRGTTVSRPVSFWFTALLYLFHLINKFHEANPFTDVNILSFSREIPASVIEPVASLPFIQESITDPRLSRMNPGRVLLYFLFKTHFS